MSSLYLQSISEVRVWLGYKKLDEFIYILLDNGYDDLDSISRCTDAEAQELENLFQTPDTQQKIRALVDALRTLGIDAYRKEKGQFKKLLSNKNQAQAPKSDSEIPSSSSSDISSEPSPVPSSSSEEKKEPEQQDENAPSSEPSSQSPSPSLSSPSFLPGNKTQIKRPPPLSATAQQQQQVQQQLSSSSSSIDRTAPLTSFASSLPASELEVEQKLEAAKNEWESALSLYALYLTKLVFTRAGILDLKEEDLTRQLAPNDNDNIHEKKIKKILSTLFEGAVFKKFKRGNSATRRIWVTPHTDYIIWGDEEKKTVKGFLPTQDVQEVTQGLGKNKQKIYVVSGERTLELEGKDVVTAKDWKQMIEMLMQFHVFLLEHKKRILSALSSNPTSKEKLQALRTAHVQTLTQGDVFKKWPGRKQIQKGSVTQRKIWSSSGSNNNSVAKLQWGEVDSKTGAVKVKGDIDHVDIVNVEEDTQDPKKFTIYATDRSLDLEAGHVWQREKWVRSLRFFIEFKK